MEGYDKCRICDTIAGLDCVFVEKAYMQKLYNEIENLKRRIKDIRIQNDEYKKYIGRYNKLISAYEDVLRDESKSDTEPMC